MLLFSGTCTFSADFPALDEARRALDNGQAVKKVSFDTIQVVDWDSRFITFITKIEALCAQKKVELNYAGLPSGVRRLLLLSKAVPEKKDAKRVAGAYSFLDQIGTEVISFFTSIGAILEFIGDSFLAFLRLIRGKARFRRSDLALIIQESGPQALPIVTLISVLIGLILAFMGAVQLKVFGAQIYVANLVAVGMAREMGAMMTAIIMAGRTGAAFAAQLGTMQVNEEIDALTTLGVSSMDFLVLPRMIALALMMPLLCLYANFMGILGGALVAIGSSDISALEYYNQTKTAVTLTDFAVGIAKATIYGVLIAISGCLRGIQCGRSASAVGVATTSAVVTAILFIIISDAIFNIITTLLGI